MKKALLITIFFMISGCVSGQNWKYTSEPKVYAKPDTNLTLAIPSLRDTRKNENGLKATGWLALIPLVPYSTLAEVNVPDGANMKPTEDFSKAIAEELNNASIFKEVYYSDRTNEADLILIGTLEKSRIKQKWTFYGLSLPGDLLWLVGAPTGRTHNDIVVNYKLVDKNYNIYFERTYYSNVKWNNGYWTNKDIFRFEETLKPIALEVVADIKAQAPNIHVKN